MSQPTEGKRVVYVSCPIGDDADRAANKARASKWVAWAATQGVAPMASAAWSADMFGLGDAMDLRLIEVADEVWLCGPRLSKKMNIEADHAKAHGKPVHVLVDPSFTDGPPSRQSSFDELVMKQPVESRVKRMIAAMAAHHGYTVPEFLKLSTLQIIALNHDNPFRPPPPDVALAAEVAKGDHPLGTVVGPRGPEGQGGHAVGPLSRQVAPGTNAGDAVHLAQYGTVAMAGGGGVERCGLCGVRKEAHDSATGSEGHAFMPEVVHGLGGSGGARP